MVDYFLATNSKHEQFRRYLEKLGALDMLTKVLAALNCYPRKSRNRAALPRIGRNEREI
uniref:Uncharacterized protein n=1 Tax=Rhinolophus ferrumequinum TaxID=59479 RepID=A0A671FVE2_RHIFE